MDIPQSHLRAVYTSQGRATEVLSYTQAPTPVIGPDEILIKTKAAGLNFGDCILMNGLISVVKPPMPATPGFDFSGVVVQSKTEKFKEGDEVYGSLSDISKAQGTCGEYIKASIKDNVVIKPANISFVDAAGVGCAASTAAKSYTHFANFGFHSKGKNVLVIGASGGVGSFCVQIGKMFGTHVTGICSTKNMDFVKQLGAERVIDYSSTPIEDQLTTSNEFDLIIDCVGGDSYWNLAQKILKPEANFVTIVGPNAIVSKVGVWFLVTMLSTAFLRKFRQTRKYMHVRDVNDAFPLVHEWIQKGDLKPKANVVFPPEKIVDAMTLIESKRAVGKVVIDFNA